MTSQPEDPGREDVSSEMAEHAQVTGAVAVSIHLCAIVLVTAALYFAKPLLLPVVLGLLVALTLIPIVRWLERRRVPAGVSAIGLVLILCLVLGDRRLSPERARIDWVQRAPTIGNQIEAKLNTLRGSVEAITSAGKRVEELAQATSTQRFRRWLLRNPA
jgi:predicted PurR-regulated permease PerM